MTDSWITAMRHGRFDEAWAISDRVLHERAGVPCFHLPRHEQYIWDGRPLAGKRVLVRCYHGLGDTVQFVRYMPLLKELGCTVLVWAQRPLLPLLKTAPGIDKLLPLHDGTPDVDYDVDIEIMELAHAFRSTVETLPNTVPYLGSELKDAGRDCLHQRQRQDGRSGDPAIHPTKIGIVWQSGSWDDRRSIPTAALEPLLRLRDVEFSAFQQGSALREWNPTWGAITSTDDVTTLAERLRALDLLVTVDSFPAHLAGALGVRAWTLLHSDPDWRWMVDRDDSPWYPTMSLFRQRRPGDWPEVIARVTAAVEESLSRLHGF